MRYLSGMAAQLLGAHMPTSGGLGKAVRDGKAIGCTAVQVFTSSPQQWKAKVVTDEMVADLAKAREETGITELISHDSYLIHVSAVDDEHRAKSIAGLKGEIERCHRYGIPYVVSHMGGYKDQTREQGLERMVEATKGILAEMPAGVTLCMETTAGQGTALNSRFEELAFVLEGCGGHPQLAVCLDTCHVFVAGYDIRNVDTYERTFGEFDRLIGIERLKVIHCNDSKKGLGSKVDRHEHIGQGEIGPTAFELLVNDKRFERVPIVLETPEAPEGHAMNLAKLKSMIR